MSTQSAPISEYIRNLDSIPFDEALLDELSSDYKASTLQDFVDAKPELSYLDSIPFDDTLLDELMPGIFEPVKKRPKTAKSVVEKSQKDDETIPRPEDIDIMVALLYKTPIVLPGMVAHHKEPPTTS